MRIRYLPVCIVAIFFTISTACASDPQQPNADQINAAVSNALKSEIPVSWVGNLMGGRLLSLKDLQVVRIGIYNVENKYWPIKIRCVGTATLNDPLNKGKKVSFDKVGDFLLYKDDYGDWKARMRGSMFQ